MKKYNLNQYDDLERNIFFWIKTYLTNKLLTINISNISFDKKHYCDLILESTSEEELKKIQKDIVKYKIMSFYNYSSVMLHFYNFLKKENIIKNIKEINNSFIYDEFITKELKKKTASTKRRFYMITINFFNFIDDTSIANDNFQFNITQNERDKKDVNNNIIYLHDNEIIDFNYFLDKNNNLEIKEKLMLKIFLFSGITASEMINLKIKDIGYIKDNKGKGILNLHVSKNEEGHIARNIPLPKKFIESCYNKYKTTIIDNYPDDNPLFFTLSLQIILQITKKAFKDSGIKKEKITTEIFRNTFAIYLKNQRFQDIDIQKLLGHLNLKATYAITKYATKTNYLCSDEFELLAIE